MRKIYYIVIFLALILTQADTVHLAAQSLNEKSEQGKIFVSFSQVSLRSTSVDKLTINGTNQSATFIVSSTGLVEPIQITVPSGFTVTPSVLQPNTVQTTVTVTYKKYLERVEGQVILRSRDLRTYIDLVGLGTPLEKKDISASKQNIGEISTDEGKFLVNGFTPGQNGFTFEFKVKTNMASKSFYPIFSDTKGKGLYSYVKSNGMGVFKGVNAEQLDAGGSTKPLYHPTNDNSEFNNKENKYYVYRYAVAPDGHVFIYRDGICIDTLRVGEFHLPDLISEPGEPVENLISNGDFEGEYNMHQQNASYTAFLENWFVVNWDQYNNSQNIVNGQPISNTLGYGSENHVLKMDNYQWSQGWGAGEIEQLIDVVPGTTYSFSAMAKGGGRDDSGDGVVDASTERYGKMMLTEAQDGSLGTSVKATSDDWQTYTMDYTPSANCKQLKVTLYMERNLVGWTTKSYKPLYIDKVSLSGQERAGYTPQLGFINSFADVDYFAFDNTGAFAPSETGIYVGGVDLTANYIVDVAEPISAYIVGRSVFLRNVRAGSPVSVYTPTGMLVCHALYNVENGILLKGQGLYIMKVGNKKALKIVIQ